MRIAVKRVDLECLHAVMCETSEYLQEQLKHGRPVSWELCADAEYFRLLLEEIINHAPRINTGA